MNPNSIFSFCWASNYSCAREDFARLGSSTAGQEKFEDLSPDILIIDEAGQAVEAETLIPLKPQIKKCLLIGDTKQLPATVISQHADQLKFGRSMMGRLIEDCQQPYFLLDTQYRMHPEISSWPSQKYYHAQLKNHPSVLPEQRINLLEGKVQPFLAPYAFIHINGKEKPGPSGTSFINSREAQSVVRIVDYLFQKLKIDVVNHVAIISFYKAQVDYISQLLCDKYKGIKISTVDGFQGGESDIIIKSCVRANQQIGFLQESRRLNVALTRARFSLIILGHQPTLENNDSDMAELIQDAKRRQVLFSETVLNGF